MGVSAELNAVSEKIIGCAVAVHKELGPGLLESVYEAALAVELELAGLPFERQKSLPVIYRGQAVGEFKTDFVIGSAIVVELKSVERMDPVFEAQLLSYLKLGKFPLGLLINFNSRLLTQGVRRLVNG